MSAIAISLVILDCMLIILCTTTYLYSGTTNKAGNTVAAVFTFLMIVVLVIDSPPIEVEALIIHLDMPLEWIVHPSCIAQSCIQESIAQLDSLYPSHQFFSGGCIFTGAAGPAFASIGALYYVVFIVLTFVMSIVVIFLFPDVGDQLVSRLILLMDRFRQKASPWSRCLPVFGDNVVDMYGNVESAQDFIKEDRNIDHANLAKSTLSQTEDVEIGDEQAVQVV